MGRPRKTVDARSRFGSVKQLASGKWRARYRHKGFRDGRTFATAAEGWEWLRDEEDKLRRGKTYDPKAAKRKFDDLVEEFYDAHTHVTVGTRADYRYILDEDLIPYFGGFANSEIDARLIRKWANEFGRTHAPGTVKKHKNVLSAFFKYCIQMKYRDDNPCSLVRIRDEGHDEMVFLSHAEVLRLAMAMPGEYGLAVRLSAYSGLRAGEMWDLKVKSLQPSIGRVKVVSNVREVPHAKDCSEDCEIHGLVSRPNPKNGVRRSARVPANLMVDLVRHVTETGRRGNDFVFQSPDGFQVRHNTWRKRVWVPTIEKLNEEFVKTGGKAGIGQEPRPHDLRHTCAALYFARGEKADAVREVLGHTSIVTTTRHYAHHFPDSFDRMVAGLDDGIAEAEREFEEADKVVDLRKSGS